VLLSGPLEQVEMAAFRDSSTAPGKLCADLYIGSTDG